MNQDKKDRINLLRRRLANLTKPERENFFNRGVITNIDGHVLSANNTLMIYLQCNGNHPSVVGGYHQWLKTGKHVIKGEHGYSILFPVGNKDSEGKIDEIQNFYTATVFDISQVEDNGAEPQTFRVKREPQSVKQPSDNPEDLMQGWSQV